MASRLKLPSMRRKSKTPIPPTSLTSPPVSPAAFANRKSPETFSLPLGASGERICSLTRADPFYIFLGTTANRVFRFNADTMNNEAAVDTYHTGGVVSLRANTDFLACADAEGSLIMYDRQNMDNSAVVSLGRGQLSLEMSEDLLLAHKRKGAAGTLDVLEARLPLVQVLNKDAMSVHRYSSVFYHKRGEVLMAIGEEILLFQIEEDGTFTQISCLCSLPGTHILSICQSSENGADLLWVGDAKGNLLQVDLRSGQVIQRIRVSKNSHPIVRLQSWSGGSVVVNVEGLHLYVVFPMELKRVPITQEVVEAEAFQVSNDMLFFSVHLPDGGRISPSGRGELSFTTFLDVKNMINSKHAKKLEEKKHKVEKV